MLKGVDAHVHLTDPRWKDDILQLISGWNRNGIEFFQMGGVDPREWQEQNKIKSHFPDLVGLCFGLHPWFIANSNEESCEEALNELSTQISSAQAVGEIGLDLRSQFIEGSSRERQIDYFRMQLELAQAAKKPCVLHLVRAAEEGLRVLQWVGLPEKKGMVHAFNGSKDIAQAYVKEGLLISVGAAVLWEKNKKLLSAIEHIPLEKLLIESDAPDQPPPGETQNKPDVIFRVAQKVAEIKSCPIESVLDQTTQNFKQLFF